VSVREEGERGGDGEGGGWVSTVTERREEKLSECK